jgi:hypothetical protein
LDKVFLIEWSELVIPTHSLAEIGLRGTVMYLSLFSDPAVCYASAVINDRHLPIDW